MILVAVVIYRVVTGATQKGLVVGLFFSLSFLFHPVLFVHYMLLPRTHATPPESLYGLTEALGHRV